jgi:regulator of cell morphogenesis and NO signaling
MTVHAPGTTDVRFGSGGTQIVNGTLEAALEREHREIDAGLEAFASGLPGGEGQLAPLMGASSALRRHIYLEEEWLFPALREAGMVAPVFVMLREHGEIWRALDELERQSNEGAPGIALLEKYRELAAVLEAHNAKEEQILYSQADRVMPAPASAELTQFFKSGQMPDGWVCASAGG